MIITFLYRRDRMWTWWRGWILNQVWGLHKWQDPDKVHDRWNFTQRIFARAGLGPLQCHHYGRSPRTVLKHRRTLWTFKVRRIKTFRPQAYSHFGDNGRWKVCWFFREYSDFQYTGTNLSCRCSLQVNLCQKLFFLQNMGRTCQKQFLYTTCSPPRFELGIFMYWTCNSMNNLWSYCGLVDAKIRASDKDLPVAYTLYWTPCT